MHDPPPIPRSFGSKARPEANAHTVPIAWVGLRWVDVDYFRIPGGALQALSARDEARARALLSNPRVASVPALVADLTACIERRRKVELEGALQLGLEFLSGVYLPRRMASFGYADDDMDTTTLPPLDDDAIIAT